MLAQEGNSSPECDSQLILPFGGGGRRKLSIIPTDADGYSTRLLKSVSNNGKNMLFVVPLQEQLSTEPLPYDSVEFAKMPQSSCMKCGKKIPLPLLPLHIEECKEAETVSHTVLWFYFSINIIYLQCQCILITFIRSLQMM